MSDMPPSRRRNQSYPDIDRHTTSGIAKKQNQQSRRLQKKMNNGNENDNTDNQLTISLNELSLRSHDTLHAGCKKKDEVEDLSKIQRVGLKSYVRSHVTSWVREVYAAVGPDQAEKQYQEALKNLLVSVGLLVAKEAQWKFEQRGSSKPIHKRADLIVGTPGEREKVLFELKVLKTSTFTKADLQQVIGYSDFFGIRECYLIGFHRDPVVWRLHGNDDIQIKS
jgi:GxxExxY protein